MFLQQAGDFMSEQTVIKEITYRNYKLPINNDSFPKSNAFRVCMIRMIAFGAG